MARPPLALLAAAAFGLLLAGCAGDGPGTPAPQPAAAPPAPAPLAGLVLDGCVGWSAFEVVPAPLHPGTRPAGWAAPSPGVDASVALLGLACQRMAIGPFERGPVRVLFESHTNAEVPAACAADRDGFVALSVLASVWVEDAEVAAHLAQVYGMPAREGVFSGSGQAWSWGPPGAPASTVQVMDEAAAPQPSHAADRFFWANGTGLGALELRHDATRPAVPHAAAGEMAPPMLLAQVAGGRFAGPAGWVTRDTAAGSFRAYRDTLCQEAAA